MSKQARRTPEPPAWVANMRPGHWYALSGNNPDLALPQTPVGTRYLEDNDPARNPILNPATSLKEQARRRFGREWLAPWSGRVGFSSITEAWNGAVFASRSGESGAMIVFGGGHNDYFGSDVHAFDLATRQWHCLSTGFTAGRIDEYGEGAVYPNAVYPDGSPLPPHTYDYMQYDEEGNNLILAKGQTELGPNVKATAIPHLLNLDTLVWRHGPQHPSAILNSGGFTTWDRDRRLLWIHSGDDGGGNAFIAYHPDDANTDGTVGSWRALHPNKLPGEANHNAMQILPGRDRIAVALHERDGLGLVDVEAPGDPIKSATSQGPKPHIQQYASLEYSAGLESLIYYSAANGSVVYAIDWDGTAHWRQISAPASQDPVAEAASQSRHHINRNHTFGRFRVAQFEGSDLAVLIRHVDSPVYVMLLPDK